MPVLECLRSSRYPVRGSHQFNEGMMSDKEIWKIIPSQPLLLASSMGRVIRIPHFVGRRQYGGTPTFGQWNKVRYVYVHKRKTLKVARLVCEAFKGPAPDGKPLCMHLDENARNNRPSNLAWGTHKENLNAPLYIKYLMCRPKPIRVLNFDNAVQVAVRRLRGETCASIAAAFGISESLPHAIVKGRTWPDALAAAKSLLENANARP